MLNLICGLILSLVLSGIVFDQMYFDLFVNHF